MVAALNLIKLLPEVADEARIILLRILRLTLNFQAREVSALQNVVIRVHLSLIEHPVGVVQELFRF